MTEPTRASLSERQLRIVGTISAVLFGVAVTFGLLELFPKPLVRSMLPYEGGLFAGILLFFGLQRGSNQKARERFYASLIAISVGVCVVALTYGLQGPRAISGKFSAVGEISAVAVGLVVWISAYFKENRSRQRSWVHTALLVGFALGAATLEEGIYLYRTLEGTRIQTWNVYHYYMASKYFAEVGYTDLYRAHLAADDEWIRTRPASMKGKLDYGNIRRARSMETYRLTPRKKLVARFDRDIFSDERWNSFDKDLRDFHPLFSRKTWAHVLRDLGYNPAQPWTIVGTTLSNLIPISSRAFWIIKTSDLPLYLLALLLSYLAFGLRLTAVMVLWVVAMPVNAGFFSGAFLRYDWLSTSLAAIALYKRGNYRLSAVALSWAAMTRVFPGFIALPIVARAAYRWIRYGRAAIRPRHYGFSVAFCTACFVLLAASHFTGRGWSTWLDWKDNITKHSSLHPATSNKRIGVPRLALHQPRSDKFWASVPAKGLELAGKNMTRRRVMQVLGLLLLLPTLLRRRDLDAMLLMLFGVFLLSTLSRYYASIWLLLFLLGARDRDGPTRWPALVAGSMLLMMDVLFYAPGKGYINGHYYLLNYEALLMFVVLCVGYLMGDWRRRQALVAARA